MNYLLFTTQTCPKCPAFKDFVQKHIPFEGSVLDPSDEQFAGLSREYLVNSVPTLIIFEDEQKESALLRTNDIVDVYDFIQSH